MRVDAKRFLPDDRNGQFNSDLFVGTIIQSFGIGKYAVQMIFLGMAIPSKVVGTHEEAEMLEKEIWEAMTKGRVYGS